MRAPTVSRYAATSVLLGLAASLLLRALLLRRSRSPPGGATGQGSPESALEEHPQEAVAVAAAGPASTPEKRQQATGTASAGSVSAPGKRQQGTGNSSTEARIPAPSEFPTLDVSAEEIADLLTLDLQYPGLRCVHKNPFIFLIDDFLPARTCDEIVRRASLDLRSSLMDGAQSSDVRRSSCTWFNPAELPCIMERMQRIAPAFGDRVYAQRVIRYVKGDFIGAHTDLINASAYQGMRCAVADEFRSGMRTQVMARIFCYLNSCDEGGCTHFHQTKLPPIKPTRGLACVFLQCHMSSFDAVPRLLHKGLPAVDEKFFLDTGWYSRSFGCVAGTSELHHLYPDVDSPAGIRFKGDGPVAG